jgi:hypothetical protein
MLGGKCTYCGAAALEPGFVQDAGQNSPGYTNWVAGWLRKGFFGGAKVFGKPRLQIDAFRRVKCSHLELFVRVPRQGTELAEPEPEPEVPR